MNSYCVKKKLGQDFSVQSIIFKTKFNKLLDVLNYKHYKHLKL